MRATRAYIASAGTATLMLGSALAMLVLVITFVAFGSWPGTELQSRFATAEPSPEQVQVAQAALDACLELEQRGQH